MEFQCLSADSKYENKRVLPKGPGIIFGTTPSETNMEYESRHHDDTHPASTVTHTWVLVAPNLSIAS
jgi:hypothetical protein